MFPRHASRAASFKQLRAGEPGPAIFTVSLLAPKGSMSSSASTRAFSSTGTNSTEAALAEKGSNRLQTSHRMGNLFRKTKVHLSTAAQDW